MCVCLCVKWPPNSPNSNLFFYFECRNWLLIQIKKRKVQSLKNGTSTRTKTNNQMRIKCVSLSFFAAQKAKKSSSLPFSIMIKVPPKWCDAFCACVFRIQIRSMRTEQIRDRSTICLHPHTFFMYLYAMYSMSNSIVTLPPCKRKLARRRRWWQWQWQWRRRRLQQMQLYYIMYFT